MVCKNRGTVYMFFFGSIVGPDYLQHIPPRNRCITNIVQHKWGTAVFIFPELSAPKIR